MAFSALMYVCVYIRREGGRERERERKKERRLYIYTVLGRAGEAGIHTREGGGGE